MMGANPLVAFTIRFVLLFLVLTGGFEAARGTDAEAFLVEGLFLVPCAHLINAVTPGERVDVVGRSLVSAKSSLHVTRGCEGIETILLLVAAVLAFPASWARRGTALLLGGALAYVLCIARLAAMHYTLRYSPSTWQTIHGFIAPLMPIIGIGYYFLRWTAPPPEPESLHVCVP
jgi:exosortase family protein XrtM